MRFSYFYQPVTSHHQHRHSSVISNQLRFPAWATVPCLSLVVWKPDWFEQFKVLKVRGAQLDCFFRCSVHTFCIVFLLSGRPFGLWSCLTSLKELKVEFFPSCTCLSQLMDFATGFLWILPYSCRTMCSPARLELLRPFLSSFMNFILWIFTFPIKVSRKLNDRFPKRVSNNVHLWICLFYFSSDFSFCTYIHVFPSSRFWVLQWAVLTWDEL